MQRISVWNRSTHIRFLAAACRRSAAILLLVLSSTAPGESQDVSLEYRVKAVYLFNFIKFVDWPDSSGSGPLTICIAEHNPFGRVLADTIRGEAVGDRPLASKLIAAPDSACHVLFLPQGTAAATYLRAARPLPMLTVGEMSGFIRQGGIVNFFLEQERVRFEIDQKAAERAGLRISSHLLRLARDPSRRSQP